MDDKDIKRKKKRNKLLLLLVILLTVSIGFALLSQTLFISGTSRILGNTWSVKWDSESVDVTDGSVDASDPEVTEEDTKVSFTVDLELPGDYYEFTIDAINAGTIDAVINNIETSVKDNDPNSEHYGETTTLPNYIHFSVTYDDDSAIAPDQVLPKAATPTNPTRQTYKVRIEYDSNEVTVPANDLLYKITYDVTYEQSQ